MQQVYVGWSRGLRRRGRRTKCAGKQGIVRAAGDPHTAGALKVQGTVHTVAHNVHGYTAHCRGTLHNALIVQGLPTLQHTKCRGKSQSGGVSCCSVSCRSVQCKYSAMDATYDTHTHTCSALCSKYSFQCIAVVFDIS